MSIATERHLSPSQGAGPASSAFAIVPSDTATAQTLRITRAIYVGVAGNVTAIMANGESVLFKNVANGTLLPLRVRRIAATGTTATDIVGLD